MILFKLITRMENLRKIDALGASRRGKYREEAMFVNELIGTSVYELLQVSQQFSITNKELLEFPTSCITYQLLNHFVYLRIYVYIKI